MRALWPLFLVAPTLLVSGCLEDGGGGTRDGVIDGGAGADEPPTATWRTLDAGQQSGLDEPLEEVLGDSTAWSNVWTRHGSTRIPPPERPEVDFAREVVVAVALGERANGCYNVRVTNVSVAPDETLRVAYTEYLPSPGFACTEAITHPYHFVAVETNARNAQNASFERNTSTGPVNDTPRDDEPPQDASSSACLEGSTDCDDTVERGVTYVETWTLAQGERSGIHVERREVIETAAAWQAFWREHTEGSEPRPDLPQVDFSRERVLAVVLGDKPSTGYAVDINRVSDDGSTTLVEYTWTAPSGPTGDALTQPHHFVSVPLGPSHVVFFENGPETT